MFLLFWVIIRLWKLFFTLLYSTLPNCLYDMLLSPVVSVCQCFAVLEDGALAHNLQEQESKYRARLLCDNTPLICADLYYASCPPVSISDYTIL